VHGTVRHLPIPTVWTLAMAGRQKKSRAAQTPRGLGKDIWMKVHAKCAPEQRENSGPNQEMLDRWVVELWVDDSRNLNLTPDFYG